jgi:protein-S-isoprenylcysteine O-methyltransferase Ste14
MISPRPSRRQLASQALVRFGAGLIVVLAILLLPAGTLEYWQAWAYIAVLFVPMTFVVVYLLLNDPELLERRMRTREKEAEQSLIVKLGSLFYLLAFLVPGFDRRFGWSHVPVAAVATADLVVLIGYGLFILVLRENSYASRVIEVEQEQRVITSGPYAIVRHPMYVGILAIFLATPVALGSWWALIPALPLVPVMVARIRNEERVLANALEGYQDYVRTTRYRLVPGVW